jgi:hypothetical protein
VKAEGAFPRCCGCGKQLFPGRSGRLASEGGNTANFCAKNPIAMG